jgi:two-component system chemotaxis sensor kinase CheA
VRVDTQRVDALVNAAGELVLVRNRLVNLAARGADGELERAVHNLDRVAGDLQAAALWMRMQPIGKLFQRFPRIVRDLARKLGKQVVLVQRGEDTQLDRTLVESLADPLVHLLRNAIDHGLEDPDSRAGAGKPREGSVTLGAGQQGERILISITDDGRGMDPEVLRRKAVEKGLIDAAEAGRLEPAECLALIFRPGFSTRGEISDISGRGVGMDVVKTNVASLGGTIDIESEPGTGTTIRIGIPLTLAIMRILMVRVGERRLALPLANVLEVFELERAQMRMLDGRVVAAHRGRPLPLRDLASWAGVPPATDARVHVVVVHVGHQQLGLLAGEVLGREDVMVKPLGSHLRHLPGLAGATITGDGRVALVLDLVALADAALPQPLRMTA